MRFRICSVLYVFAFLGAALATFGGLGILAAVVVLGFWTIVHWPDDVQKGAAYGAAATLVLLCSCGLLLPAMGSAKGAAQRNSCRGQMTQIALALWSYNDVHKSFPPAFIADKDGKPMHSWRVLVLPFMGMDHIYEAYNFDEPWDGPNNRLLASKMPSIYRCPGNHRQSGTIAFETQYLAIVDEQTALPGSKSTKLSDITDGTHQTILFMEVHGEGVNWMEPRDVTMEQAIGLLGPDAESSSTGHFHESVFHRYYDQYRSVAFADMHIEEFACGIDASSAEALCTVSAGDSSEDAVVYDRTVPKREVRWEGVYGFAVFSVLAVLPFPWWAVRERIWGSGSAIASSG